MIASHYAETIGRKVEEGSIKGDSVKPNAMYTCHYEPTPVQQEPCYCKDPILPGGGSDGGNSRWNEFIIPGKTMASGLVEKGMQESMYEVGTAFTLHGQRFAGTVYSGEATIYAALQKDPPVNFPEHPHYHSALPFGKHGRISLLLWSRRRTRQLRTCKASHLCARQSLPEPAQIRTEKGLTMSPTIPTSVASSEEKRRGMTLALLVYWWHRHRCLRHLLRCWSRVIDYSNESTTMTWMLSCAIGGSA